MGTEKRPVFAPTENRPLSCTQSGASGPDKTHCHQFTPLSSLPLSVKPASRTEPNRYPSERPAAPSTGFLNQGLDLGFARSNPQ